MVITTGIVLAGGRGERFGKGKYSVLLDNRSLIERAISILKKICNEILVVTSREIYDQILNQNLKIRIVLDILPGKSAMGGLYTGLMYSNTKYNMAIASDMPFLNSGLMQFLIDNADGFDAVVPMLNNYIEPLHTVYSKSCTTNLKQMIDCGDLSLTKLLKVVNTKYITAEEIERFDPNHLSFFNINTQTDLNEAKKIIENQIHTKL